jgi:hypothetical protein
MPNPEVSYQVTCPCGQLLSGTRQTSFQVVRCPACGSERFILPRSPYSSENGKPALSPPAAPAPSSGLHVWRLPLLAAAVTAVFLLLIYLIFLKPDHASPDPNSKAKETRPAPERLKRAEKFLGEGHFRLAANELVSAPAEILSPRQTRQWQQLQREAALLADLCAEPIEDILRHAAGVAPQEWQAEFPHRYQGKAFLFDVHLWRLPNGQVQADYVLPGPNAARLEWRELEILRNLDLDRPRRVILGVRLARINLEPPGPVRTVRFQPKSGVWLTDERAAALCCPPLGDPALGDPEALAILKRQAQMVGEK